MKKAHELKYYEYYLVAAKNKSQIKYLLKQIEIAHEATSLSEIKYELNELKRRVLDKLHEAN